MNSKQHDKYLCVLSREEFTSLLQERLDSPSDIGRAVTFVEGALTLQNDMGRPVYILEVSPECTPEDIGYIHEAMTEMGTAAVLLPPGAVRPVAALTPESMGITNIKERLFSVFRA